MPSSENLDDNQRGRHHHDDHRRRNSSSLSSSSPYFYDNDGNINNKRQKLLHHHHHHHHHHHGDDYHNGFGCGDGGGGIGGSDFDTMITTTTSPYYNPTTSAVVSDNFNSQQQQQPNYNNNAAIFVSGCETWWDETHLKNFVYYGMEENQLLRYNDGGGNPITKCYFVTRTTAYIALRCPYETDSLLQLQTMTISKGGEFLGGVTLNFQPWNYRREQRRRRHSYEPSSLFDRHRRHQSFGGGGGLREGPRRHSDTLVTVSSDSRYHHQRPQHQHQHQNRGGEPPLMVYNSGGRQPSFAPPSSSSAGGTKVLIWSIGSEEWTRSWLLDDLETEMRKFALGIKEEEGRCDNNNNHHHHQKKKKSAIVDAYQDGPRGEWVIEMVNADIAMKLRKELICTRSWWVCGGFCRGFEEDDYVNNGGGLSDDSKEVSNLPNQMDSLLYNGDYHRHHHHQQQQQQGNTYREDHEFSSPLPPHEDEAAGTSTESSKKKKQRLMVFQRPPSNIDGSHLLSFLNDHLEKNNNVVSCRANADGKKTKTLCKIGSVSKHHGDTLETCWVITVDSEATRIVVSKLDDMIFQNSVLSFHEYVNLSFHDNNNHNDDSDNNNNKMMLCDGDGDGDGDDDDDDKKDEDDEGVEDYYGNNMSSSSQSNTSDADDDSKRRNHEEQLQPSDDKIKQKCLAAANKSNKSSTSQELQEVLPIATTSCDNVDGITDHIIGDDLKDHQYVEEMAMKPNLEDQENESEVKTLDNSSEKPSSPTTPLPKDDKSDNIGIISPDTAPMKQNGGDNKMLFPSDADVTSAAAVDVERCGNAKLGKDSTLSSTYVDDDISLHEGDAVSSSSRNKFIVDATMKARADSSANSTNDQQSADVNRINSEDSATKSSFIPQHNNEVAPAKSSVKDKNSAVHSPQKKGEVLVFAKEEWVLLQKALTDATKQHSKERELVKRLSKQVNRLGEEKAALVASERSVLEALMINEEIVTSSVQENDRIKKIAAVTYQDLQNATTIAMTAIQELQRTKNAVRSYTERFAKRELDAKKTLQAQEATTASAVRELETTRGQLKVVHGEWQAKCDQLEDMKRQLALQTKLIRGRVTWKDEVEAGDISMAPKKEHQ